MQRKFFTPQISVEQILTAPTLAAMASRRKILSPMLRLLAAATLFFWMAAMAQCASDCVGGSRQHDCCHKKASGNTPGKPLCLHSQTIASSSVSLAITKPDLQIEPFLISEVQSFASNLESKPVSFRRAPDGYFVFTPEVCLGPAFRSLAPPVSA
jgi:hypothetical protein